MNPQTSSAFSLSQYLIRTACFLCKGLLSGTVPQVGCGTELHHSSGLTTAFSYAAHYDLSSVAAQQQIPATARSKLLQCSPNDSTEINGFVDCVFIRSWRVSGLQVQQTDT